MSNTAWHEKSVNQVLGTLETSPPGLHESEAKSRLRKHGMNRLKEEKGPGKLSIFIGQFSGFLIRILIGATIFSALVGEVTGAVAIIIIVIISAILGFIQEYRAENTMAALRRMAAHEAIVIRNGKEVRILSERIVPGDIVLIEEGSKIPADMRILEAIDLKVDEACLTGESAPVTKTSAPMCVHALADMKNMLWSGTTATYGRGKGVVVSTGMSTQIGKIAHIVQETGEEATPLQKKLDSFGHRLGILILAICALVVVIGLLRSGPLSGLPITQELVVLMVMTGIALAVAAIPEGLPAIVTITLALGLQRLSRRNALMRKLPAVETLGSTTVICSDKTGTLTKNEMTVTRIWHSGKVISVTGGGYSPEGKFLFKDRPIHPTTDTTLMSLLRSGALCTNARLVRESGAWNILGDPTEGSLVVASYKAGLTPKKLLAYGRVKEFPFSSERRRMSVVTKGKSGEHAHVKGAPETILSLCTHIMKSGRRTRLTRKERQEVTEANQAMTGQALRVLAVATRPVKSHIKASEAESGLTFLGLMGMIDPPRESVKKDISLCRKAGIKVVMITGDHANTAYSIAKELSLSDGEIRVLTGEELDKLSDSKLRGVVQNVSVYARVNPEHKVRIVDALRRKGNIIAMTGDGVNDAPALKKADIGVAMGIKGTDVSKEAADMILRDDNFSSIVMAIREGRAIYDNIKKFIQYLLSSNVGEVLVVFLAMLIGFTNPDTGLILIPLTAIQLLWINLLTDGFPALALGVDPPSPDIMERPPRNPKEKILSRAMLTDIFLVGVIISVGTLFLFWINLPQGPAMAVTVAFTTIVMFEMVRVQSVRMKYNVGLFSNRKLLLAIAFSVSLQLMVIYAPYLHPSLYPIHDIFSTTFLGISEWIEILLVSSTVMIVMFVKDKLFRSEL